MTVTAATVTGIVIVTEVVVIVREIGIAQGTDPEIEIVREIGTDVTEIETEIVIDDTANFLHPPAHCDSSFPICY